MHRSGGDVIVAICDEDLLGKKLDAGRFQIHLREDFYGGDRVPVSQLRHYISEATIINAFGDNAVRELAAMFDAVEYAAIKVGGVLHVQLILKI